MTKDNKPLYSLIVDELKAQISSGVYKPEDQLPTEAELSARYGVSRITTRRALEELERDGFIYRVKGSGSFVKSISRAQAENRTDGTGKMISLILPSEDDRGTMGYIRGASDWLNANGYYLSVHQSDYDSQKERDLLETLTRSGIAAIILYPRNDQTNYDILHRLCLDEYPIVTIDKYFDSLPLGAVVSDNFGGAYKSVSRLIELGHRKIAFLSAVSIESTSSVRDRYFGYCKALKDHGIPVDSRYIQLNMKAVREEIGVDKFYAQLLDSYRSEGVTAVQTENDLIAANLLNRCLDAGIRVPADISIIGFDNNPVTQHVIVPLTTVEQHFYEIGRRAAEIVVNWLERGKTAPGRVLVPVELVERGTAGAAPE
ncbi:GntR family transcriptional regulator [Paenibacillus flagellatus]|uniref:GntR family transcriptional regulator n=1 Tax=Paenibacillus flagellatus TaxID=2211139 RepID=A0A2V5L114_9BACL|nr:GntR family transcriptional regulator [Paenibacillus flagellatus]PYI56356.1 GntR family transcriptional regulator [Paenibacillus flagellatus]